MTDGRNGKRTRTPRLASPMTLPDLDLDTGPLLDRCTDPGRRESLEVILDVHNQITWACKYLLGQSFFGADLKSFREELRELIAPIRKFNAELLNIRTALEDVPYSIRNALSDESDESGLIDDALSTVSRLDETENLMMSLQSILNSEGGKGRDIDRPGFAFVKRLASAFRKLTGQFPTVSYDPAQSQRSGPFVDFVADTLAQLRLAIDAKFPAGGDWSPEQLKAAMTLPDVNVQALIRLYDENTSVSTGNRE